MPTLNWIGKEAVVNHHHEVPFHLLKDVPDLGCGDPGSGNLIVEGDNLTALKALLPYYAGQVKCIYIDPPYNTGNEGWAYNDNVNSPVIQEWLGKVVGKEGETLDRHDRWLCMMYPRLALLRCLLKDDGVIFASIDENELSNLLAIMDEMFGRSQRVAIFTWVRKKKGSNLSKKLRKITEFIVVYRRGSMKVELRGTPAYAEKAVPLLNRPNPSATLKFPPNSLKVGKGFRDGPVNPGVKAPNKGELAVTLNNKINVVGGVIINSCELTGRWRWSQETVDFELSHGSEFVVSKDFRINVFRFNQDEKYKAPQSLITVESGVGTNEDATEELKNIFSDRSELPFNYPKPSSLISYLIQIATNEGDIVLDAFAGSGTTGHAALLPTSDRRFILVQMPHETEEQRVAGVNIASTITAERVRRVIKGYRNAKGEEVPALGGGFRFCQLGDPLFDETGAIRSSVKFAELARHVYFSETGEPLPRERVPNSPFLGECRGVGIYLLFNGILGDKSSSGGNMLTRAVLAKLPPFDGPRVIYCTGCLLGRDRLAAEQIVIRQTPYEIKTA